MLCLGRLLFQLPENSAVKGCVSRHRSFPGAKNGAILVAALKISIACYEEVVGSCWRPLLVLVVLFRVLGMLCSWLLPLRCADTVCSYSPVEFRPISALFYYLLLLATSNGLQVTRPLFLLGPDGKRRLLRWSGGVCLRMMLALHGNRGPVCVSIMKFWECSHFPFLHFDVARKNQSEETEGAL